MPWEDPATAFRSASTFIPPEIAAKKAAAAVAEAQALADQAQVHTQLHSIWQLALPIHQRFSLYVETSMVKQKQHMMQLLDVCQCSTFAL